MADSDGKVFAVGAAAFCISFVTGLLQNCGAELRPNVVRRVEYSNLYKGKQNALGQHLITYDCKGKTLFSWNVDTKHLSRSFGAVAGELKGRTGSVQVIDGRVLLSFFGGVGGAWTVKDLVAWQSGERAAGKFRRLGAVVIGAVSGYSAGSWIGARYSVPCDSPEVAALLVDDRAWPKLERDMYVAKVLALNDRPSMQTLERFGLGDVLALRVDGLSLRLDENDDYRSFDYAQVEIVGAFADQLAERVPLRLKLRRAFTTIDGLLTVIPFLLLVGLGCLLAIAILPDWYRSHWPADHSN